MKQIPRNAFDVLTVENISLNSEAKHTSELSKAE